MTQSSSSITNSRLCKYCNKVQIYWNNSKGTFVEVETGNKHFCQSTASRTKPVHQQPTNRPTFTTGSGKPFQTQQHKQPTKNSIQVLKGTELEVQKQYETLSDIVTNLGGKIHGSQSHYVNTSGVATNNKVKDGDGYYKETLNSELRIIVYYEVPATGAGSAERDNRELVKSRMLDLR